MHKLFKVTWLLMFDYSSAEENSSESDSNYIVPFRTVIVKAAV